MSLGYLKFFLFFCLICTSGFADPIEGVSAKFKLLDKITNKVTQKTINVNSTIDWDFLNMNFYFPPPHILIVNTPLIAQ